MIYFTEQKLFFKTGVILFYGIILWIIQRNYLIGGYHNRNWVCRYTSSQEWFSDNIPATRVVFWWTSRLPEWEFIKFLLGLKIKVSETSNFLNKGNHGYVGQWGTTIMPFAWSFSIFLSVFNIRKKVEIRKNRNFSKR